ncbi:hypothetical protein [Hyalangium sp.]|uniref:hypothetical protein n=1 Tax=Hyalangium sp. TaxID=2028555 RepID=UPI002D4B2547|nr:hypothetical protein [Hyalangium sp.]HYI01310.1 hypothetical protein [Hyalangium sp.]
MTTIAANNPSARLNRSNSAPLPATSPKPELTRSNTAPAATTPASKPASTQGAAANTGASSPPSKVADSFSKAGSPAKGWHGGAVNQATADARASGTGPLGRLKAGAGLAGGAASVVSNGQGLADAIKNNEGGQAIAQHALGLGRGVLGVTKGALDTAAAIESTLAFNKIGKAATAAVGNQGKLAGAIANAAAEAVHNGKPLRNVDVLASIAKGQGAWSNITNTTKMTVADKLRDAGFGNAAGKLENSVAKAGQKAAGVASTAGDAAQAAAKGAKVADGAIDAAKGAEAALKVGAKGAGTAARLAGRFAPGLNIAMAGVDTAIAARTLSDPKASIASKVTSSITAAGSIAAATNIPIVSQVGAGISAVSSVTGLAIENAGKIKDGFKSLGDKIKSIF